MSEKISGILLKEPTQDVVKFILKMQAAIKASKGIRQFSMEQTIYKIIREHPEFKITKGD